MAYAKKYMKKGEKEQMKKLAISIVVLLAIMANTGAQAFDMMPKSGINPPEEIIYCAKEYCKLMISVNEKKNDPGETAEWYDRLVALEHRSFAYSSNEKGIWWKDTYTYAARYKQILKTLYGFK